MEQIPKTGRNALIVKPDTERYLFNLQLIYTSLRDPVIWDDFFRYILKYANSIVLKKNTGKVYLPPDQIGDKITNVTSKFMEKYLKSDSYKIEASFFGVLDKKAFEALYDCKEEDLTLSLNSILGDEDKDMETTKGLQMQNIMVSNSLIEEDFFIKYSRNTIQEVIQTYSDLITEIKGYMLASNRSPKTAAKMSIAARMIILSKLLNKNTSIQWEKKLFKDLNLSNKEKTAIRLFKVQLFKTFY